MSDGLVAAIIPARAGSKGLPGKNLIDLGGRPLIDYSLAAAAQCDRVDVVLVSTDLPGALARARLFPKTLEVGLRPSFLCTDEAPASAVLSHSISVLEDRLERPLSAVAYLEPTNPFRRAEDLAGALDELDLTPAASGVVGVCDVWHHPSDYVYLPAGGVAEILVPRKGSSRRQDFQPNYMFISGALYIARPSLVEGSGKVYDEDCIYYSMPKISAVHIDEPLDLAIARGLVDYAIANGLAPDPCITAMSG